MSYLEILSVVVVVVGFTTVLLSVISEGPDEVPSAKTDTLGESPKVEALRFPTILYGLMLPISLEA